MFTVDVKQQYNNFLMCRNNEDKFGISDSHMSSSLCCKVNPLNVYEESDEKTTSRVDFDPSIFAGISVPQYLPINGAFFVGPVTYVKYTFIK